MRLVTPSVRPMATGDLPGVAAVEARVYPPDVCEGLATLRAHFEHYAQGCWVATCDAELVGYVISSPARCEDAPLELGLESLPGPPPTPDTVYLHDMAVLPGEQRGRGLGSVLLARVEALAAGLEVGSVTLTSVCGSRAWWGRRGYEGVPKGDTGPGTAGRLASYPVGCGEVALMRRALSPEK